MEGKVRKTYIRHVAVSLCFLSVFTVALESFAEDIEFPVGRQQSMDEVIAIQAQKNTWQTVFELPMCPLSWCSNVRLKVEHKYSRLPRASVVQRSKTQDGAVVEEKLMRVDAGRKNHIVFFRITIDF